MDIITTQTTKFISIMISQRLLLTTLVFATTLAVFNAHAIVIRDDVSDQRYLAKPEDFPPLANLYQNSDEQAKKVWFIGIGGTGNGIKGQTIDNAKNNGVLRKAQNTVQQAKGPLLKFVFNSPKTALPLEGVSGSGDSGGPAYRVNDIGNRFELLGISSRRDGYARSIGQYGVTEVYSRISYLRPWIKQVMQANEQTRQQISRSTLNWLPSGLTQQNLLSVCAQIGVKPKKG